MAGIPAGSFLFSNKTTYKVCRCPVLSLSRCRIKCRRDHPVLCDRYMEGTEVEVDGISDGVDVVIPGIMEHVERAGVHSGDSIAVYPPQTLSAKVIYTIIDYTERLGKALHVKGLLNIQFVVKNDEVYIIEVNPRSSRTVPTRDVPECARS